MTPEELFEQLNGKEHTLRVTQSCVTHKLTRQGLKNLFDQNPILVQNEDGTYGIRTYVDGVTHMYHYRVGNNDPQINVTGFWQEYLQTGDIASIDTGNNTQMHQLPLPIYNVDFFDSMLVPCVQLKNGKRGLLTVDGIVEGIEMPLG
jgi:hypothetical protein